MLTYFISFLPPLLTCFPSFLSFLFIRLDQIVGKEKEESLAIHWQVKSIVCKQNLCVTQRHVSTLRMQLVTSVTTSIERLLTETAMRI